MSKLQISILVTIFCCFWYSEVYSQCVACGRDTRNKIFYCQSAGAGGNSCATSTGQTQCTLIGVCGPGLTGKDNSCNSDTIGEVVISKEIIAGLSKTSTFYADAVRLVAASGSLGSTYAKVLFFPDYEEREKNDPVLLLDERPDFIDDGQISIDDATKLIEIEMEIIYKNNIPSAIRIAQTKGPDGVPAPVELNIQRRADVMTDGDVERQWIVTSWVSK